MSRYALGLIETRGLISIIEAADAAAKTAAVVIVSVEYTGASRNLIRIEGELGAVQAAVEAGAQAAERIGELVAMHVIPNPDDGLSILTPKKRNKSQLRPNDKHPPLSMDPVPSPTPTPPDLSGSVGITDTSTPPPSVPSTDKTTLSDLRSFETMTVVELRKIARGMTRLHLKGREISKANKQQLIDAIRRVIDMD